ncbi:GPI inositol deacylase [Myotisia sp. PD_48]|nr:GPI inositol deacylase [Myotisia sp. PD_48]
MQKISRCIAWLRVAGRYGNTTSGHRIGARLLSTVNIPPLQSSPNCEIQLRDYQEECIQSVLTYLREGHKRLGISLATGSGKTVIFTQLINRIPPPEKDSTQTLILVHRKELVEQAAKHCMLAYPSKTIDIEMANSHASGTADITIASIRSLLSKDRLEKYDPKRFKLILVDEAHHIVARSYREALAHFGLDELCNDSPVLVGVSATFSRPDGLKLGAVIDHIVYHKNYVDMIGDNWLANAVFTTVKSNADLSRVGDAPNGDFQTRQLSSVVNTETTNEITVSAWISRAKERKSTLVFCVDIEHVECLTAKFRQNGIDARYITSQTPKSARAKELDEFKKGSFPVLVNCGLFTEGTDIPNIDCVLLARPTRSKNLLIQMIGRGLRLHPGKKNCHIIDMVASLDSGVLTTPTLLGLHPDEGLKEMHVEDFKWTQVSDDTAKPAESKNPRSVPVEDIALDITDYDSVYDLLQDSSGEKHVRSMSDNAWVQVKPDQYILGAPAGRLTIFKDESGNYSVHHFAVLSTWEKSKSPFSRARVVASSLELEQALNAADTFANRIFGRTFIALRQPWRRKKASVEQINFLRKSIKDLDPRITKGQAADMITKMKHGARSQYKKGKIVKRRIHRERAKVAKREDLANNEVQWCVACGVPVGTGAPDYFPTISLRNVPTDWCNQCHLLLEVPCQGGFGYLGVDFRSPPTPTLLKQTEQYMLCYHQLPEFYAGHDLDGDPNTYLVDCNCEFSVRNFKKMHSYPLHAYCETWIMRIFGPLANQYRRFLVAALRRRWLIYPFELGVLTQRVIDDHYLWTASLYAPFSNPGNRPPNYLVRYDSLVIPMTDPGWVPALHRLIMRSKKRRRYGHVVPTAASFKPTLRPIEPSTLSTLLNYLPLEIQELVISELSDLDAANAIKQYSLHLPDGYWRRRLDLEMIFEVSEIPPGAMDWQYFFAGLSHLARSSRGLLNRQRIFRILRGTRDLFMEIVDHSIAVGRVREEPKAKGVPEQSLSSAALINLQRKSSTAAQRASTGMELTAGKGELQSSTFLPTIQLRDTHIWGALKAPLGKLHTAESLGVFIVDPYYPEERGVDEYSEEDIGLTGVPVLFLPGNAGSYRQGRSLASEASLYFHHVLQYDQDRIKTGTRSLDFFMADFNEDMAAFHGQTILDQAEYVNDALAYILSLYHDPRRIRRNSDLPDPVSVILIGHSMGGIVARTVLTMENYQTNSVNTIITMSTPHARPPVSFDSDLVHTYKQINSYWREAYSQRWANNNPLWHVTLISIAGGGGDTVVPSDYSSLSSLVPETNGFTVFTSTIPKVWTGMDHLSIAWCDSFRKVIVRSLFDIADVRRGAQTKQRAERMDVFKKWYLTGMESSVKRILPSKEPSTLLTLQENSNSVLKQGETLVLRGFGHQQGPQAHLIPVPPRGGVPGKKFTLLTDQTLETSEAMSNLEVLFCSDPPSRAGQSATLLSLNLDLSGGNAASPRLVCKSSVGDVIYLPASTSSSKFPFDDTTPFSYLQYDLEDLIDYQFVAVVDKSEKSRNGFLVAEFSDSSDSVIPTRVSLGRLLSAGLTIRLPANRPMVTDIKVPALRSSLLAYKLKIEKRGESSRPELFAPIVRQYISEPHESKFFVNVREADINLHGVAPYMPPHLRDSAASSGIAFQLWTDSSQKTPLQISLQVDFLGSLGKLTMRYRTVFAAFPLVVVALVFRKQFKVYDQTGFFISFSEGLDLCLRSSLPLIFLGLSFLASSLATSSSVVAGHAQSSWRTNATETSIDFGENDLLLGSQDVFFWFLVPLFGVISVAVCAAVNYVTMILVYILGCLRSIVASQRGYIKHENGRGQLFWSLSAKNRLINTLVLFFFVATVIPYQFAYIVACIVQLITCVRASSHARESRSNCHHNVNNFAHSMLILMLWILPINILVLIVWVHNLAVHWLTPFSSHHNVLSIMPFMLVVEILTTGAMVPRITSHLKYVTSGLFFFLAIFAAVYGVTYAYLLHHITNAVVAWLLALYFFGNRFSLPNLNRATHPADVAESTLSDGHVKKLP